MRMFLEQHPEVFRLVPDKSGKWLVRRAWDAAYPSSDLTPLILPSPSEFGNRTLCLIMVFWLWLWWLRAR